LAGRRLDRWTALFLATTVATSVTGFFYFPFDGFTPAQVFGILSMVLLALAIYGRYSRRLSGAWCKVYVITALAALYLNVFVGIVQSFQKIPALKALAPTQTEPPFFIAQAVALALFIAAGIFAVKRFHGDSAP
jgi:magnesium-transporting ATPase (P-type)